MNIPTIGQVDPLAVAALVFLVLVLAVSTWLFGWVNAQMKKPPGVR